MIVHWPWGPPPSLSSAITTPSKTTPVTKQENTKEVGNLQMDTRHLIEKTDCFEAATRGGVTGAARSANSIRLSQFASCKLSVYNVGNCPHDRPAPPRPTIAE